MTQDFTYWEEGNQFIGYLNEFPDYWTQGSNFEDLKEHLRDLYQELRACLDPSRGRGRWPTRPFNSR